MPATKKPTKKVANTKATDEQKIAAVTEPEVWRFDKGYPKP